MTRKEGSKEARKEGSKENNKIPKIIHDYNS